MAIGNYRTAGAVYRPTHVAPGRATTRSAAPPDVAGAFGTAFDTTVKAGLRYYKGVQDVGAALQGIGQKVSGWQSDAAATQMMNDYGGTFGVTR